MAIGIDFGTMSGRVLLLDLRTGEEVAIAEVADPHGVIDARLPLTSVELPPDTALQDPGDYLEVFYRGIPEGLESGGVRAEDVIGIGIEFTACTVLPVTGDGTPFCELDGFRDHPYDCVRLWKHHSAQPIADRLNEVAISRGEAFLTRRSGGSARGPVFLVRCAPRCAGRSPRAQRRSCRIRAAPASTTNRPPMTAAEHRPVGWDRSAKNWACVAGKAENRRRARGFASQAPRFAAVPRRS